MSSRSSSRISADSSTPTEDSSTDYKNGLAIFEDCSASDLSKIITEISQQLTEKVESEKRQENEILQEQFTKVRQLSEELDLVREEVRFLKERNLLLEKGDSSSRLSKKGKIK